MSKVAVVYWSGTGNTEAMKDFILQGIKEGGGSADEYMPWDFKPELMDNYTNFAFGCPAMGEEQLETEDFEPMWEAIKDKLTGKNVVLFGSYNWNDGEWIEHWAADAVAQGANLVSNTCPCLDAPAAGSQEATECINLGKAIATA